MNKPIYVYASDANTSVDAPSFRISRTDASHRLQKGYVRYLSEDAVQLMPPAGIEGDRRDQIISGLYDQAWMPRWSACYLVWQMRTEAPMD